MKTPKTIIALCSVGLMALLVMAWSPTSSSFNTNQFSAPNFAINVKSGALITNTVLQAASGGDVRTLFANQVPGTIVQGDGTVLWFDALSGINVSFTNGATPVYMGKSVLVNGGVTGTENGVPWTIGYLTQAGVPTNSVSGDIGNLTFAQLAAVLGVFGVTNSIFGGTFGTNADFGQSVFDAQGNLTHTSTNQTYVQYGREGTNGTPFLLKVTGTNSMVTVSNLTVNGTFQSTNFKSPTNTPAVGQIINATSIVGDTAWSNAPAGGGGSTWQRQTINGGSVGYVPLTTTPYAFLSGTQPPTTWNGTINTVTQPAASGGYLSNLTFFSDSAILLTTNIAVTIMTNVLGTTPLAASALTLTLKGETLLNYTNSGTTFCPLPAAGGWAMKVLPSANLQTRTFSWSVEWWHQ